MSFLECVQYVSPIFYPNSVCFLRILLWSPGFEEFSKSIVIFVSRMHEHLFRHNMGIEMSCYKTPTIVTPTSGVEIFHLNKQNFKVNVGFREVARNLWNLQAEGWSHVEWSERNFIHRNQIEYEEFDDTYTYTGNWTRACYMTKSNS